MRSIKAMLIFFVCGILLLSACSTPVEPDTTSYDWGSILKNDAQWFGGDEAIDLADKVIKYQLPDGGWRKAMGDTSQTGSWAKSTIDNDATTSQIQLLAKAYNQTGKAKYKNACIKGIKRLLEVQYENGGWPQVFDDEGTYHAHITYNDNAMVHVLYILTDVKDKAGDFGFVSNFLAKSAAESVEKGIECILNTQIKVNGEYTGWCQQHDELTLEPTMGRAYELASISSSESVAIVNYLKSIADPDQEIINRINAAIKWMDKAQLSGIRVENYINEQGEEDRRVVEDPDASPLWARFYNLHDGVSPLFVSRESVPGSSWDHIGAERRAGYAWYGSWPKNLVKNGYME